MKSIKLGFIIPILLIMGLATNAYAQIEIVNAFPNLSFSSPLGFQHAGDGSNMLYVVERAGRIERFENVSTVMTSNTFLDIRDSVSTDGEGGLLGLAFHPNFSSNRYFYVYYTKEEPADSLTSVISRFERDGSDPSIADPLSELVLLEIPQPKLNHNAGQISFGSDGYLYIALGDGGGSGDPFENGQDPTTLLGSILRIDVDNTDPGLNYSIPTDMNDPNPFVGNSMGWREEIYAYGLRNPYRFSFDAMNGDLWVGDVGQNRFEEIDFVEKGDNLGWNTVEGFECFDPMTGCDKTGLKDPVFVYSQSGSQSVTGGFVYRGSRLPELQGRYVYGDFASLNVWSFAWDGSTASDNQLIDSIPGFGLVSFGQDQNNELYICSFDGNIYTFASTEDGNEQEVTGTLGQDGWRFLGTPRTDEAYNSLLSGTWTQGATGASTTSGEPNVLVWDETTRQFEAVTDLGQDIIPNAQGFIAYMYEDDDPTTGGIQGGWPKTLTSSGTLKTGTANFPISFTASAEPEVGFNLVSNPYPFSIDWEAALGWTKTNMEDAIYVWDPNANGGDGAYKQLVDGVGDDINLIAPFQAFFVQASGSGAALSANETVRQDGGVFLKNGTDTGSPIITLKLKKDLFEDNTYITFKEGADFEKDRKDALKLQSLSNNYVSFFTRTDKDIALAVNSMPRNLPDTSQVPLFVETTEAGEYEMDWELKDLPIGFDIIIEDLELGRFVDLNTEKSYRFNVTSAVSKVDAQENSISKTLKMKQAASNPRFIVHIYPKGIETSGGNTEIIPSRVVLEQNYPNPFNPNTVIRFGLPEASNVDIRIFNIIGQEVMRLVEGQRFSSGFHNVNFDASRLSSGIYIYQVRTKEFTRSRKMTIIK